MYNSHVHTENSLDSSQSIFSICEKAIAFGIKGFAVTDHVDMWFYDQENTEERIRKSLADVDAARMQYGEKIEIYKGVEMAEYLYDPKKADIIMQLADFDIILGSVHSVFYKDVKDSYSRLPFDIWQSSDISEYLNQYFLRVKEMAEITDIDVLSHLTCPMRYINGKFGLGMSLEQYHELINEILSVIIERNIALEVNTSGIGGSYNEFMPDYSIVKEYYDMGGRLVTIGTDAHVAENIANGMDAAIRMLNDIGFRNYHYYVKREVREAALHV